MTDTSTDDLLRLTADIVSAHVSANATDQAGLIDLIRSTHEALRGVDETTSPTKAPDPQEPAVPIKRSVFPDYIICLEDGKQLKMLKRHLQTAYNMTMDQYRAKWGLPPNYPMVAPSYAKHRSALAKKIGLGRKPASEIAVTEPAVTKVKEGVSAKRRGRPKAAA